MKAIWGADIQHGTSMLSYIGSEKDKNKAKANFDRATAGEEFTLIKHYGDSNLPRVFYEIFCSPFYHEKEILKE